MCRRDCGPEGQYIGSKPRPRKTRWPCRGRRPRVTGLVRHVCAQRIVAQRANILVASPRPTKTCWPCRGGRPRINKPLHQCGLPICRPSGALTTLARRCFATDMSPLWGFNDAGAAMLCYQYVAPLGLFRQACAERIVAQRANILVASPAQQNTLAPSGPPTARYGACAARMCRADCGPAGQYIGSKPPPKKTHWPCKGRRPRINNVLHRCGLQICRPNGALTTLARRCFATDMSPQRGFSGKYVPSGLWPSGPIYW